MQYGVCLYSICVLSHIEICISSYSFYLESLNETTWSSSPSPAQIPILIPVCFLCFLTLPIPYPFIFFFSPRYISLSLHASLFYLFLNLDSSLSSISNQITYPISSVQFSHSVVSDSLRPYESLHTRPPCPSPTPRVHPDSCPSSQWCHPAISSSVVPFPPASNPSQHQSLFQWVNSSHEVAKVLEVQL